MGYVLGIDLGTTYTAAAVLRDGRTAIVDLGTRQSAIPSVVLLREDETVLTGEAASRRGMTEPDRIAREFKRRVGDPTPILLGGAPISVQALMAKLIRWVVDTVTEREGGPPDRVGISHPANWGAFKVDVLQQAVRMANLTDVDLLTEPEAAAIHYASQERVEPGSTVAVYDLGGGTFDASVLRKTPTGWEVLGQPEGIDRLGGIDFDAAVFAHVARSLEGKLDELDPDDPNAQAAVARLRDDCVDAKEALSSDTDVSIPVLLPNVQTEVRLTRAEFEAMIRPSLADSIDALRRALRSADVLAPDVTVVLLVGGSSRVPLVAQLVSAELGRPVALDVHPKHAVALGAAVAAAHLENGVVVEDAPVAAPPVVPPPAAPPPAAAPTPPPSAVETVAISAAATAEPPTPVAPPPAAAPPAAAPPPAAPPPVAPPPAPVPAAPASAPAPIAYAETQQAPPASRPPEPPPVGAPGYAEPPPGGGKSGPPKGLVIGVGVVAVLVLVAVAAALLLGGGGGEGNDVASDNTEVDSTEPGTDSSEPDSSEPDETTAPTTADPAGNCDRATQVCIIDVRFEGEELVADYETEIGLTLPTAPASRHAHFYLSPAVNAETSGTQAGAAAGSWSIWATPGEYSVFVKSGADGGTLTRADIGTNTELCVTVADENHATDPTTQNCHALPV